jgi:hypothetical protein
VKKAPFLHTAGVVCSGHCSDNRANENVKQETQLSCISNKLVGIARKLCMQYKGNISQHTRSAYKHLSNSKQDKTS